MAALSECCDARGAGIALVSAQNRQRAAWNIESALVDGFVLLCAEQGELLVSLTEQRELPFVALALDDAAPRTPAIAIDNATGARLAAEHLLGLGHQQFAILGIGGLTPGRALRPQEVKAGRHNTIRERADGYWQALGAAGIAPESVPFFDSDNDQAGISQGLEVLFAGSLRPTALLAMSDRVAFYAMDWLIERGIGVPEDVSIIGFDGVPEGAESVPPLTTVQQPMQAIAQRAVDAILDGPVPDGPELLDLSLLVRHSTAAPATN
jgi:DNA-binding LacI/PurR family transcriptional regulator